MDLKVAFVIVCLCALAITSTEAGIPRCCFKTKKIIHPQVLHSVVRWNMQENSGPCDIPALVLHVKNIRKPICAHPNVIKALEKNKALVKKRALMRLRRMIKPNNQKAAY